MKKIIASCLLTIGLIGCDAEPIPRQKPTSQPSVARFETIHHLVSDSSYTACELSVVKDNKNGREYLINHNGGIVELK